MLTGLLLAIWIDITGAAIPGINPFASFDYNPNLANECAVDILCGPGFSFTQYSHELADLGSSFSVGPRLYGITGLPNGQLSWNGVTLNYATNGPPGANFNWSTPDAVHFLFLRTAANSLYVAIEDLPAAMSDNDYNDALHQVQHIATPEPGSLILLGSGLAALARLAKRRRAQGAAAV
ncbi:MAG: PEP-CTERM sorting domain-containing protein [Acidobacteria bacterium]|nr:PEP-CTERM sorting domain-containing protein [Acidobacteriota bacterium]